MIGGSTRIHEWDDEEHPIDIDLIVEAFEARQEAFDDMRRKARTVRELSQQWEISERKVRTILRGLIDQGRARSVKVFREDISGRTQAIPGYVLVGESNDDS